MYAHALERFEGVLRADPDHRAALRGSAGALLGLDRSEEARERFARYVELEPQDPGGHVGLARAETRLGRKAEALASLRAAVEAGLDDVGSINGSEFEALQQDIRFMQLTALVAQRAGVRPTDDRGRLIVGGRPVRSLTLPSRKASE